MIVFIAVLVVLAAISVVCAVMGTRQSKPMTLRQARAAKEALDPNAAIYAKARAANQRAYENYGDPDFEYTPEEKLAIIDALLAELNALDTSPHAE